ncbi:uncharacterized protein LOC134222718 [Armigeres subalbatus]|uniref:uncharacterized protein LOC134222718 n=1 Tax=Armigeres subalbatus TaxID=124917 RepID=UPI002ED3E247
MKQGVECLFQAVRGYRKVLVGGDFNAHHSAWDPQHSDNKGAALFDLINEEDLVLLNKGQATFVPVQLNKIPSAIDLVIVSPGLFHEASMNVLDFGVGSRHLALETIIQLGSKREIWDKLRKLAGKKKEKTNILIHEDLAMAEDFLNKYFPLEANISPNPYYLPNYDVLSSSFWCSFLAKKSKPTTPGPDGISYSSLKLLSSEVRDSIVRDLNNVWRTNNIPENMKTIKIVAIPKPGKNPETVEGTRPLSMLNCGMKILNAAVLNKLQLHLENRHILPSLSFGFRKGMSTVGCLEYVTNKVFCIKREKKHAAIIFIDLSNAFNTVKLDTLENVMLSLGLPPEFSSWVHVFLAERKIQLQVGNKIYTRYISQGLPQGDILSPTLFNIYTTKLHEIQIEGVVLVQYADDFAVTVEGRNIQEVNERANRFMERFAEVTAELNLAVNAQKTKAILFANATEELDISVHDEQIEQVNVHKYLGLWIDKSLRFGAHIREITKKAADRLNMLKVISGTRHGSHPTSLNMAYNAFFRSFIEYGSSIYSSACKTNLKKIDTINNACLRKITGCTKTTPTNTLHSIAAQPPLQFRRLKVIGKQLAKHHYWKTPVWEQTDNGKFDEQKRYTYLEQLAAQHGRVLKDMSTSTKATPLNEMVHIETMLSEELWTKKQTDIKVLRQLSLSLIHGKYQGRQIIYTDASSTDKVCGIGIYNEAGNVKLSLKLENFVCIMSAELEAIYVALQYIDQSGITRSVIMTDSMSGCKYLQEQLEQEVRDSVINKILEMAARTNTSIQWIPGHVGVRGNEMADHLAKSALESTHICRNKMLLHDVVLYFRQLCEENAQQWYLDYTSELGKGRKYFQAIIRPRFFTLLAT